VPGIAGVLAEQIARMLAGVRKEELRKVPGVAETLDWAAALVGLGVKNLHDDLETAHDTLRCLLKTQEDRARLRREVTARLIGNVA
jgi:RecJ-like exonuclease